MRVIQTPLEGGPREGLCVTKDVRARIFSGFRFTGNVFDGEQLVTTERTQISRVLDLLPWTNPVLQSTRHGLETTATVATLDASLDSTGALSVVSEAMTVCVLFFASGDPHSTSFSGGDLTGSETPELQWSEFFPAQQAIGQAAADADAVSATKGATNASARTAHSKNRVTVITRGVRL